MSVEPLTWYPGTVLPYASLWHTLVRATWLNDLRAGDIRHRVDGKRHRHGEQATDHQRVRDLRAVASALAERQRALSQFAVIEQFPDVLRTFFMVPGLRWCPMCLAGGFHTLLGSIQLVTRCPLHAVPLIDACPQCAAKFTMGCRGLAVRLRQCRCTSTRLLEPLSARQPSFRAEDVAVWAPVARWVRQVGEVTRSSSPSSCLPRRIELALTPRWCRDFGIGYPDCFDDESSMWPDAQEPMRWSGYEAKSSHLRQAAASTRPGTSSSWPTTRRPSVYRAMGRHLRRHGLAHPDRWIRPLMQTFDPAAFAVTMVAHPKARVAFTEMLWARRLEPGIVARRWLNRPAPPVLGPDDAPTCIAPTELHDGLDHISAAGPPVSVQTRHWMAHHAMAIEARHAWGQAWHQAQRSIADGWADWSGDELAADRKSQSGGPVWFCRAKGEGMRFVGYVRDAVDFPVSVATTTKQQRCDAQAHALQEKQRCVDALASRPCLGWSTRDGWRVEQASRPDDDVRRVALLHTGQRTACWVFRSDDRFVARLADGVIQVSAATVREALSALRQAVGQYRRAYGAKPASAPVQHAQVDSLLQARAEAALRFRLVAAGIHGRGSARFWAAGPVARSYRPVPSAADSPPA